MPAKLENVVWNCSLNLAVSDTLNGSRQPATARLFRKRYMPGKEVLPGSNCQFGQLTSVGAEQHQALGAHLRARYVPWFLPANFDPQAVWIRSTDLQRTILSAYNFIQGGFPGSATPEVVDINVVDEDKDDTSGGNSRLCPRLGRLYAKQRNSTQYVKLWQSQLGDFAARFSATWNMTITPSFTYALNDVVRSRLCHNMPLPPGLGSADALQITKTSRNLANMVQNTHVRREEELGAFGVHVSCCRRFSRSARTR